MSHPFKQFYPVWDAQKLLDWAYRNASKKSTSIPKSIPMLMKIKRKEMNRIKRASDLLIERIEKIVKSVPNLDELPLFYKKLSNILVDNDKLRKSLGRINGVIPVIKKLVGRYKSLLFDQKNAKGCSKIRVEFFGRCSSLIRKLNPAFKYLDDCREALKQIPPINLTMPNVVVAGYPNVGKSTLVGQISSAKPMISSYPFTTKQIFIGVYKDDLCSEFFQVIDTPGILDRPMEKRNKIEKQAILALNTIATLVLFVFDPTPTSGYSVDSQIQLFNEIKEKFLQNIRIPLKIIINKIDFATDEEIDTLLDKIGKKREDVILMNAKEGENVEKVVESLLDYFRTTNFRR